MTIDLTTEASQFSKAVSSYTLFSAAISWQLNAVPYLCGVHKLCLLQREETMPAVHVVNSTISLVCTSLVPRLMIVVFGLGTRVLVRMRTQQKMF